MPFTEHHHTAGPGHDRNPWHNERRDCDHHRGWDSGGFTHHHHTGHPYGGGFGFGGRIVIPAGPIAGEVLGVLGGAVNAGVGVITGERNPVDAGRQILHAPGDILEGTGAVLGGGRYRGPSYRDRYYARQAQPEVAYAPAQGGAPQVGEPVAGGADQRYQRLQEDIARGGGGSPYAQPQAPESSRGHAHRSQRTYSEAPSLDDVASGNAVLKIGQAGQAVETVQRMLNKALDVPPLNPDGVLGTKTQEAIFNFQQRMVDLGKLDPSAVKSGEVNAATLQLLDSESRAKGSR